MKELSMTEDQFKQVILEIQNNHKFGGYYPNHSKFQSYCNKYIKYVRPDWDMRDGMCFSIRFDGMGCGKDGKKFGSGYGETEPLFDQIMKWLSSCKDGAILSNHGRGS